MGLQTDVLTQPAMKVKEETVEQESSIHCGEWHLCHLAQVQQCFAPLSFIQDCGFSLWTNKRAEEMPKGCSNVIYPARDYELL